MQSGIVKAICQVGVFIVCAQVLVHFRPDRSYEKYLKMLVSIMILLQVLQPVNSLLNGGAGTDLGERVAGFEQQMEESMRAAAESREEAERLREQMTLEEVRRRLEKYAGESEEPGASGEIPAVEEIQINIGKGGENNGGASAAELEEMVPQG